MLLLILNAQVCVLTETQISLASTSALPAAFAPLSTVVTPCRELLGSLKRERLITII